MITSTSWGVLVSHHRQQGQVSKFLTGRGIEHFLPMIETLLVVRGRHVREQRPLLGDYMLTSISSGWKSLIAIRGVAGILLNDSGFPAQVLPHEMQRMRSACDGDVYRSSVIEEQGFEYNQKVSPKEGPFACHVGRYDIRTKRGDSARFWLFGREQRVTFKSGDLVAV